jgi:hypothetical protein
MFMQVAVIVGVVSSIDVHVAHSGAKCVKRTTMQLPNIRTSNTTHEYHCFVCKHIINRRLLRRAVRSLIITVSVHLQTR